MNRVELFEIWAPPASIWSPWAKPILFAEWTPRPIEPPAAEVPPAADLVSDGRTGIIVNLPGVSSVQWGCALAHHGYRPVPLFNSAPGPSAGLSGVVVVETETIMHALVPGAAVLKTLRLPPEASPAFLLDANRHGAGQRPVVGQFDNRWLVFPQDFPSAGFLQGHGLRRVVLVQSGGAPTAAADLAHVLLRWQEGGIELSIRTSEPGAQEQSLHVNRPARFKALWYRSLAVVGLRRNSAGGFGSVVPEPSAG